MNPARPKILFAYSRHIYDNFMDPAQLARLEGFAEWDWLSCEGRVGYTSVQAQDDPADRARICARIGRSDALVVCHGAPFIDGTILDLAPDLRFIGELEGDRFAGRIDLDAAWARGICTVDVTNGSSYPVAEWALGLILVSMRNAGAHFRRIVEGKPARDDASINQMPGQLTGKRVGLVGCGHMGRRLLSLLRPFQVEAWVYDPYLPHEMAEALGFLQTSLDNLLSQCDVIVCLAPLTSRTEGMIGERELGLMRSGAVFVNVSRGAVVDSAALIARLTKGDIIAGLDVFDPEPIAIGSEIRRLPNVFLSPHIGYHTGEPYRPFLALMVDELARFFSGHEPHYRLTPAARANRAGGDTIS